MGCGGIIKPQYFLKKPSLCHSRFCGAKLKWCLKIYLKAEVKLEYICQLWIITLEEKFCVCN